MNRLKAIIMTLWMLTFSISAFAVYASGPGIDSSSSKTASSSSASTSSSSALISADTSLTDGKAEVDTVEGKAFVVHTGSPIEKALKEGDELQAGDSIYTEKGASVTISFDSEKLNVVKFPESSKAKFVSIEPTNIQLQDGSIFNEVDGLAKGSSWKISTPAAIAAVRGTSFEVNYSQSSGEYSTATFEDTNAEKLSAIEIESPTDGSVVQIIEGKQMALARGQLPSQSFVQKVSPERAKRGEQYRKHVTEHREKFQERRREAKKNETNKQGPSGPGGPGGHGNGKMNGDGTKNETSQSGLQSKLDDQTKIDHAHRDFPDGSREAVQSQSDGGEANKDLFQLKREGQFLKKSDVKQSGRAEGIHPNGLPGRPPEFADNKKAGLVASESRKLGQPYSMHRPRIDAGSVQATQARHSAGTQGHALSNHLAQATKNREVRPVMEKRIKNQAQQNQTQLKRSSNGPAPIKKKS